MTEKITITLTNEQMTAIKNIEATTRYEAMDKVAKILGAKTGQKATWASSRKTIVIDKETIAEIKFSKGKVLEVQYYYKGNGEFKSYEPINIKNWTQETTDDESIKRLQRKLAAMLLPR